MGSYGDAVKEENEVPLLVDKMLYPNCPGCRCAHLSAKALPISSLLAFLYFMIDDFHIAKRTEDIGYYAGAIVSVYMVGRALSSVPWGMFADKYGRRPAFYLGLVSIIVLQPVFGIAPNYWVAFAARFLLGIFNGVLGPCKAYASEICSPESQAWGLNVSSTTWSLGLIIGPAIGGFLSRPVINFPGIFKEDSVFALYPYLLPSIIQAGFAAVELGIVYYLPETIHNHDEKKPSDIEVPLVKSVKSVKPSLWLNGPLMASVAVYCVYSLYEISFNEIFSMWCVSPEETGGLALRTSDVGTILAISGFGMLCTQLAFFPPLTKILGPIWVMRLPALVAIPVVVSFPFMPYLHGEVQWLSLNALALLRNSCSAMVITGCFLLVNNAVGTDQRGAANGISMSGNSIFRAVGPAAGGVIFAWGQSRHDAIVLPGSQLVFFVLSLIAIVAIFIMLPPCIPKHLDKPYAELNFQETDRNKDKKNVPLLQ